jgi:hypothetical protein
MASRLNSISAAHTETFVQFRDISTENFMNIDELIQIKVGFIGKPYDIC